MRFVGSDSFLSLLIASWNLRAAFAFSQTSVRLPRQGMTVGGVTRLPRPYVLYSDTSSRLFMSSENIDPKPSEGLSKSSANNDSSNAENGQLVDLAVQGGLALAAVALVYVAATSLLGLLGGLANQAGTAVTDEVWREAGNLVSWLGVILSGVLRLLWQVASIVFPAVWQALVALFTWVAPVARNTAETVVAPALDQAAGQLATVAAPYVDQASTSMAPFMESARTAVDTTVVAPMQGAMDATANAVSNTVGETIQSATASVDANFQSATDSLQDAVRKGLSSSP